MDENERATAQLKALLAETKTQEREEQFLLEVLAGELAVLRREYTESMPSVAETTSIYNEIRVSLSPSERDEFFLAVLDEIKGCANVGRQRLRGILRSHFSRLGLIDDARERQLLR